MTQQANICGAIFCHLQHFPVGVKSPDVSYLLLHLWEFESHYCGVVLLEGTFSV
jgi:hypothetical protein